MKVVYVGPYAEVEIAEAGWLVAPRGVPVEVSKDLGERMLEQSDIWEPAPDKKPARGDTE